MSIVIKTKKVVSDKNEIGREITSVKMIPLINLPEAYTQKLHCEFNTAYKKITVRDKQTVKNVAWLNSFITEENYQKLLKDIRICGENLREVNKERKRMMKTWNGKCIDVI